MPNITAPTLIVGQKLLKQNYENQYRMIHYFLNVINIFFNFKIANNVPVNKYKQEPKCDGTPSCQMCYPGPGICYQTSFATYSHNHILKIHHYIDNIFNIINKKLQQLDCFINLLYKLYFLEQDNHHRDHFSKSHPAEVRTEVTSRVMRNVLVH